MSFIPQTALLSRQRNPAITRMIEKIKPARDNPYLVHFVHIDGHTSVHGIGSDAPGTPVGFGAASRPCGRAAGRRSPVAGCRTRNGHRHAATSLALPIGFM